MTAHTFVSKRCILLEKIKVKIKAQHSYYLSLNLKWRLKEKLEILYKQQQQQKQLHNKAIYIERQYALSALITAYFGIIMLRTLQRKHDKFPCQELGINQRPEKIEEITRSHKAIIRYSVVRKLY